MLYVQLCMHGAVHVQLCMHGAVHVQLVLVLQIDVSTQSTISHLCHVRCRVQVVGTSNFCTLEASELTSENKRGLFLNFSLSALRIWET